MIYPRAPGQTLAEQVIFQVQKKVMDYLNDEPVKIVLFGSRARNEYRTDSDIDIGIIPLSRYDEKKLTLLREALDEMNSPWVVEIVDLSRTSDAFRESALKDVIWWKD